MTLIKYNDGEFDWTFVHHPLIDPPLIYYMLDERFTVIQPKLLPPHQENYVMGVDPVKGGNPALVMCMHGSRDAEGNGILEQVVYKDMPKQDALQKIMDAQGFVPFSKIFEIYEDNDLVPGELIKMSVEYPGRCDRQYVIMTSRKGLEEMRKAISEALEESLTKQPQ